MIAGKDAPKHGEAKNSWHTGTAAWTFVNVSQYILGIQPDFDGLHIDPCIPPKFTEERSICPDGNKSEYYVEIIMG